MLLFSSCVRAMLTIFTFFFIFSGSHVRVRSCSFLGTEPDLDHAIKKANIAVEEKQKNKEKKINFLGDLSLKSCNYFSSYFVALISFCPLLPFFFFCLCFYNFFLCLRVFSIFRSRREIGCSQL